MRWQWVAVGSLMVALAGCGSAAPLVSRPAPTGAPAPSTGASTSTLPVTKPGVMRPASPAQQHTPEDRYLAALLFQVPSIDRYMSPNDQLDAGQAFCSEAKSSRAIGPGVSAVDMGLESFGGGLRLLGRYPAASNIFAQAAVDVLCPALRPMWVAWMRDGEPL